MLLIFDGDCGFCTSSARWIERRLPDTVRVAPWQILDLADVGLTEADVTTSAWWVDDGGGTHGGHAAIGKALVAAGRGWRPLGRLMLVPPGRWIAAPSYRFVARNRHRLPGATDACRVDLSATTDGPAAPTRDRGSAG